MVRDKHIVYVVDDEAAVREAIADLLGSSGFSVRTFASAADYIGEPLPDVPACLVLDVQLPDINGLDLQSQIADREHPPIVFITGHGDIPSSVRAMKAGAVDFLPKPFKEDALLAAIEAALERHRTQRSSRCALDELRARYRSLTSRERDVLPLVVSGLLNKQAAARLNISVVTLQIHRGSVMRKMAAHSLAELVRMAAALEIPLETGQANAPQNAAQPAGRLTPR